MSHHPPISKEQKYWRVRIFAVTWLAYAGFYLCRKNFSVAMPIITRELETTKEEFAIVLTAYSLMYMLGQFLNGFLSDKKGPRIIVTIGLLISVAANILMGWSGVIGFFVFLMGLNGLGQSAGWSGTVKNLTPWFRKKERGVVMSFWTTCYVVGGIVATAFATYWATHERLFVHLGWKRAFWAPAVILLLIATIYFTFTKNRPSDANIGEIDTGNGIHQNPEKQKAERKSAQLEVIRNPAVWLTATMYLFVKFTRYAFLFWLPLYLSEALEYSDKQAGYTSIAYEAVGFLGVIAAGFASDYLFKSRRFPVGSIMLFALAFVLWLQPMLTSLGMLPTIIAIGLIGFFTYGPDSLMSGAAAMDLGKEHGAALSAGIINGVGSIGQLISPFAVALVVERYSWNTLFHLFVVVSLLAGFVLLFKWNYGKINTTK